MNVRRLGGLVLVVFAAAAAVAPRARSAGVGQTVEVRQLEVGYELGGGFKARVTLVTGEALDFAPADASEAQTVLRLAELFASGRSAMSATVDGRNVKSLQCLVRRGASY